MLAETSGAGAPFRVCKFSNFATYSLLRTLRRAAHGASGGPRLPPERRGHLGPVLCVMSTRIEIKFTRQNTQIHDVHAVRVYHAIYIRVVSELCWVEDCARNQGARAAPCAAPTRAGSLCPLGARLGRVATGVLWLAVALPARLDAPGAPNSTPLTPSPPHEETAPPRLPLLRPAPRAAEAARPSRRAVRLRGAAAGW